MAYQTEPFAETLRRARVRKGWSQRELSAKAGMPQAHISRIESGAVDPRLSTLTELARLLDLDVVLAPRAALSAVQVLIQDAETDAASRSVRSIVDRLKQHVRQLRIERPKDSIIERLERLSDGLYDLTPQLRTQGNQAELLRALGDIQDATETADDKQASLRRGIDRLANLRNALIHSQAGERPAYSLDEEG